MLPFSGVMFTVLVSKSKSIHSSCHASPDLAPVSFRNRRNVAVFGLQPAINSSISRSKGMNGSFLIGL